MADIQGLPNPVATDNEEAYLAMLAGVEGLEMPKIIANNKEFYLRYLVENGGGGGGEVVSVNGKKGIVVLSASDIKAQNTQSIQDNLERIDDDVAIRQVTMSVDEWPDTLTEDFLYRVTNSISHGGKTYGIGLYQVVDNDLEKIGTGEAGDVAWGSITGTLSAQTDLKNALDGKGTYSKPSTGIPKSDLASAVQTSLGRADSALQEHQDISGKQDKLTAGANITIVGNVISATGGSGGGAWGSITGTLSNQTDLQNALDSKQGSLNTAQLAAVNSGINSNKVDLIGTSTPPFASTTEEMTDTNKIYLGSNGHLWSYKSQPRKKLHWVGGQCVYAVGAVDDDSTFSPAALNSKCTSEQLYFQNGKDIYLYFTQNISFTIGTVRVVYFDNDNKVISAEGNQLTVSFVTGMQIRIPHVTGAKYARIRISTGYNAQNDTDYVMDEPMSPELAQTLYLGYTTSDTVGASYQRSASTNAAVTELIELTPGDIYEISIFSWESPVTAKIIYYGENSKVTSTETMDSAFSRRIVTGSSDKKYIAVRKGSGKDYMHYVSVCKVASVSPTATEWVDTNVAYANYAMTESDKTSIAQKVLEYLDVTHINPQNVLTVGNYELRYENGDGLTTLGEVDVE